MRRFFKILKKVFIYFTVTIVVLIVAAFIFIQQNSFGKNPSGERLKRVEKSVHYKDGSFVNETETQMMAADANWFKLLGQYFKGNSNTEPSQKLPSKKPDYKFEDQTSVTWFGHSTLLLHINGKNILVDPIFSQRASPVQYAGSKAYEGTEITKLKELPAIDLILITHDHYDHLDYNTILFFRDKPVKFIVPLGVGSHLEFWKVDPQKITELEWWEETKLDSLEIICTPARHFSGRGITDRNKTLWASWIIKSANEKIYCGGDSGFEKHYKEIGEKYGPFDIAFLECGQYNKSWPFIHMMPEQTVQASIDLKSKILFPVHWGKFTLALHDWNEPATRVSEEANKKGVKLFTPYIGEKILIKNTYPENQWWKAL